MKNCPKGCGKVTEKKHCGNKNCPWYVCEDCNIMWHPDRIHRTIPWMNGK